MTTPDGRHAALSGHPEPEVLMDYWLAALPADEEDVVEQHLMECDACGDRLRHVIALADSLRALARSGVLQVIVDESVVARAKALGLHVREYAPLRGASVACTVAADDDVLVARLAADLSSTSRVDLSWSTLAGDERQRMTDIPIRPDVGSVICQQSMAWAKGSPTTSMVARLLAIDEQGRETLLGEYTFHHTRTIPGPASWEA